MTAPSSAIRVAVIEDIREVREGLTRLFAGSTGFSSAGSFRTMEEALGRLDPARLDVILTDIGLPGMDGIAGTRVLRERFPGIPVVALTGHAPAVIQEAIDSGMRVESVAFLRGSFTDVGTPDALLRAVRERSAQAPRSRR